jgi:ABC-type transporter Mla subunit MlaD
MSGVAMSYDLFISYSRRDNTEGHVIRNSLAGLLGATNRLDEAEQLLRQSVEMFFKFTRAIGHPHSSLQGALKNYAELLQIMDRSEEQVFATLHELTPEFFGETI